MAELLTRSLHAGDDDKNEPSVESEFTIVVEPKSVVLKPRPKLTRDPPFNLQQWNEALDADGRINDPATVKKLIFKGVSRIRWHDFV